MAAKSPAMRIVVLGSGAVGKSSLTVRLTTGKFFEDYDPVCDKNCSSDHIYPFRFGMRSHLRNPTNIFARNILDYRGLPCKNAYSGWPGSFAGDS